VNQGSGETSRRQTSDVKGRRPEESGWKRQINSFTFLPFNLVTFRPFDPMVSNEI